METMTTVRARCIYSKVGSFKVHQYYKFAKRADYPSFSVYIPVGAEDWNATRLLDECAVLVIECGCEVLAVFEVC